MAGLGTGVVFTKRTHFEVSIRIINEQSDFRQSFTFVAIVASLGVIYIDLIDPSRPPWCSIVVCMLLVLHHNLFGADLCIKTNTKHIWPITIMNIFWFCMQTSAIVLFKVLLLSEHFQNRRPLLFLIFDLLWLTWYWFISSYDVIRWTLMNDFCFVCDMYQQA